MPLRKLRGSRPASGPVRSPPLRLPQWQDVGQRTGRRVAGSLRAGCARRRIPRPQCGSRRHACRAPAALPGAGGGGRAAGPRSLRTDTCPSPHARRPDQPPPRRARNPRPRRGEPLRGTLRGVAGVATQRFTRVCYTVPFPSVAPLGKRAQREGAQNRLLPRVPGRIGNVVADRVAAVAAAALGEGFWGAVWGKGGCLATGEGGRVGGRGGGPTGGGRGRGGLWREKILLKIRTQNCAQCLRKHPGVKSVRVPNAQKIISSTVRQVDRLSERLVRDPLLSALWQQ